MKFGRIAVAALATALSMGAAQAITVHRSVTVEGIPRLVWLDIGGFCDIENWHPAVAECTDSRAGGVLQRTLSLQGGGTIVENQTDHEGLSYSYEIVESPLPVRNYHSTIKVSGSGNETTIEWSGWFDADGATNAEAAAVIAGIYEAGLDQIAADYAD
jgi:hypothetical protein